MTLATSAATKRSRTGLKHLIVKAEDTGDLVGLGVTGESVGRFVGEPEGAAVGEVVGERVGDVEGETVGASVGEEEGDAVGKGVSSLRSPTKRVRLNSGMKRQSIAGVPAPVQSEV